MSSVLARGVDDEAEALHVLAEAPAFPGLTIVSLLSHADDLDVFDVWCAKRRTRCVLKAVREDRVDDTGVMRRFRREAELVLSLTHPNIVRAYEIGEFPVPYVLEEAVTGHTLSSLYGRRPRLTKRDVLNLADHLSAALSYLHDQGILHLDLKPSNIIAECGRAKLIDFSLAHPPGRGPAGWGTDGYLAPEQDAGEEFTTASDVWGLGMVLAKAPTRRLPVEFRRLIKRCLRHAPEERPSLAEIREVVSRLLGQPTFAPGRAPVAASR